jgi:hypothetical protein
MAGSSCSRGRASSEVLQTFGGLVERLAPAAVVVPNRDARAVHKLCVVGKAFTREQAIETCAKAGSRPCMLIYSGDLTPMVHTFRTSFKIADHVERREGRSVVEWCVHQAFFSGSTTVTAMWFDALSTRQSRWRPKKLGICLQWPIV